MPPGLSDTSSFFDAPGVPDAPVEEKPVIEEFQGDLVFNGINGDTGEYGLAPMPAAQLASMIQGKPYAQQTAERQALERAQPALKEFTGEQWNRLLSRIDEPRRTMLLALNAEKARLLVKLCRRPWDYEQLTTTLSKLFADLEPARFAQLLDEQQAIFNTLVQESRLQLFFGVTAAERQMLQAMIDEQYALFEELKENAELREKQAVNYGLMGAFPTTPDVKDPADLAQAGWGILFPQAMANERRERIQQALGELLELRRQQAGPLFHIYAGPDGYRPGDTKSKFLQRHKVGAGLANPKEMPFYLLLIGSPEEIPYDFEDQLDVMRGVGRLDFGDDMAAYATYAHNVVLAETGKVRLPRKAVFFSVANPDDKATQLSSKYLIRPLRENLSSSAANIGEELTVSWDLDVVEEGKATHAQLRQLLGGDAKKTPALLMTASHGMEFPNGDARQMPYQGALLCQNWPGPKGKLAREHYFAGEDLKPDANVMGMIAVFFACYGAGTPRLDQFAVQTGKERKEIAPQAFVADLPKQLLKRGALAVLGHVERAWGYSFVKPSGELDNAHFVVALRRLLNGQPVGLATDPGFDLRYADMSSELSKVLEELKFGNQTLTDFELTQLWTASNDARGYTIIGDPAVRIPFAKEGEKPAPRPELAAPTLTAFSIEASKGPISAQSAEVDIAGSNFAPQMSDLTTSLQNFSNKIVQAIKDATDDILTLEVETYSTEDIAAVAQGQTAGRQLRAFTRVEFDGDMQNYVPTKTGGVDQDLWKIHIDMVREAQSNRAQFISAMAELAANLLKSLK